MKRISLDAYSSVAIDGAFLFVARAVSVRVAVLPLVSLSLLAGCSATVQEHHYFATYSKASKGEPVNFFRVDVTANSQFSNARYVAGYYDERAVDLFFSELKSSDQTLFKADLKNPGTEEVIKPLDPGTHGAFVMVLSTNADDIVNAIGAFAENEVVAKAVTQLANKSELQQAAKSDASASSTVLLASGFAAEISKLADSAASAADQTTAQSAYLHVLQRLSAELGGVAPPNFKDAYVWFQSRKPQ